MRLAAHQPDLFPWTGFWFKMDKAGVFDLAIYDQFQKPGYQQRVRMGEHWASIPTARGPSGRPINEIRLSVSSKFKLVELIEGRYRHLPFFEERWDEIHGWIMDAPSEYLWEFNFSMILRLRDLLGITTPIAVATKPQGSGIEGLIDLCRQYGAESYLSGTGGGAYMGPTPSDHFLKAGKILHWSGHDPRHGESILRSIFELENPLDDVRRGTTASDLGRVSA